VAVQQQINLYQPMFRKQKKVFSASSMLGVFVAALIVFGGVYGFASWNVYSLEQQSETMKQEHARELVRLEELSKRYPVRKKSKSVEQQLKDLQKERQAKQYLVNTLSDRSIGNSDGFSEFFVGIAKRRLPGMWLNRLELGQGGNVIGIYGSTVKPELVPQFLQELAAEDSFQGSNFRVFSMQRDSANVNKVNFSLRTVAGGGAQ